MEEKRVHALRSLIDYQDKGIVSRTLLRTSGGIVTLFALDTGETLDEHAVPHEVLVYLVEGQLDFTVSGETYSLKEGDILSMHPGEVHTLRAVKATKMLLIQLRTS